MERGSDISRGLLPLSWVYGAATWLRNRMFDIGILPQRSYPIPTICVGNLAVGGTGKTPMTEYLIRLLTAEGLHVATLSRGYGRRTKGFIIASAKSTAADIGDEPRQMKQKFPGITVAVCEDRCHGVEQLLRQTEPRIDVVLLDDAYQHRYLHAGLYVLLTDCSRPYSRDALLPAGRLRESRHGADRAQMIVVTKCPTDMTEAERRQTASELKLHEGQQLFFSEIRYMADISCKDILLLTGIANPAPIEAYLRSEGADVRTLAYPDHHRFSDKDVQRIAEVYAAIKGDSKAIVTTEKDAQRLEDIRNDELDNLKSHIVTLPIRVGIMGGKEETFNQNILSYVRENQRSS